MAVLEPWEKMGSTWKKLSFIISVLYQCKCAIIWVSSFPLDSGARTPVTSWHFGSLAILLAPTQGLFKMDVVIWICVCGSSYLRALLTKVSHMKLSGSSLPEWFTIIIFVSLGHIRRRRLVLGHTLNPGVCNPWPWVSRAFICLSGVTMSTQWTLLVCM